METSASFEARSAPSSYPTTSQSSIFEARRDRPEIPLHNRLRLLIKRARNAWGLSCLLSDGSLFLGR